MANFVFNIAKGRPIELYRLIKLDIPLESGLVIVLLAATGLETDAVLKDKATLADVLSGTTDEATNTGYARKVLTDAQLAAFPAPDNTNDRYRIAFPDQIWTAVQNDGTGAIAKLLVCYDPDTTAGTDADIIPLTAHDSPVTPNGTDITTQQSAGAFFQAGE